MPAIAEAIHQRLWPRADRRWLIGPLLLLVGIPLLMLLASWAQPQPDIWQHLSKYLLPRLIGHTALMMVVVGLGVAVLGVGLAWLSACCDFPLRRILDPLLVMPLAFPTYVLAFIYLGMLDYAGPVQTFWRDTFGSSPALFEAFSRPGGVLFILVLAFYPYVYLLARAAFVSGGLAAFEASRSLGQGPLRTFFRVSLPMARPALVAGLALALMETLADFGAVSIYGFDTFTTAIYRTWLGMFNLTAAVQLASILMLFVLLLVGVERLSRNARSTQAERRPTGHRIRLKGLRGWAATAAQITVLMLGVVLPLIQLLVWAWPQLSGLADPRLVRVVANTMVLGMTGALAVVAGGILLLVSTHRASRRQQLLGEMAALGYAIPGTVLAVAIMFAFLRLDQLAGTALAGGMSALVIAYLVRFVRVAWGPLDGVASRIRPHYVEVARSLGVPRWYRLWRVNLPLLWPGLVTAFLLALVEVAKEMPATLVLRPFGWETLAVRIYELTAEGQWEMAAVPALLLVILGAIPVTVLIRSGRVRAI
ncbi:iron ABC transporter permease [Wenzhouxiangella sp. XN201]|uniref:ABC transporter permease subunit n=1 Tax=Wenzhouxiangella sp. XN201 TaxID=2710755 RepID=UPI001969EB56